MAEIAQDSKGQGSKGKPKKLSTRVDFTPMVDLGFLLITFFMLATTLSKPQTMEIAMPSKDKVTEEEQTKVKASRAVTIILDKDNAVYYYEGTRDEKTGQDPAVIKTDFSPSGIRKFLIKKNYDIMVKVQDLKVKKQEKKLSEEDYEKQRTEVMSDKTAPIVLIKATDAATYGNLVNILDEMAICNIGRYAIVDISDYDKDLLKKANS
jgi:biopolymer transport protein ExbD